MYLLPINIVASSGQPTSLLNLFPGICCIILEWKILKGGNTDNEGATYKDAA